jgi:hypothetical protein
MNSHPELPENQAGVLECCSIWCGRKLYAETDAHPGCFDASSVVLFPVCRR